MWLGSVSVGSPLPTSFPNRFPAAWKAHPCGSMLPCGAGGGDIPSGVVEKPGHAVWMWRLAHLPFRLKTAQPSGSGPTKKGLPRRVTLQRACGGFWSRHDSRHVSSAITNLHGLHQGAVGRRAARRHAVQRLHEAAGGGPAGMVEGAPAACRAGRSPPATPAELTLALRHELVRALLHRAKRVHPAAGAALRVPGADEQRVAHQRCARIDRPQHRKLLEQHSALGIEGAERVRRG